MPIPDIRYAEQLLFFLVFGVVIYAAFRDSEDSVHSTPFLFKSIKKLGYKL